MCFSFAINAVEIPKQLSSSDRSEVTRLLGLNTSHKLLTNPYPLGGYSGVEIGISLEVIDIQDLSRLGCDPGVGSCPGTSRSEEKELRYPRISIGKGLYNDVDVFFNFIPPSEGAALSDFGGSLRWGFYQAQYLPIVLSLLIHGNQINVEDTFANRTLGSEIIAGITVNDFAIYFGGGFLEATGQFMCGNSDDGVVLDSDPACKEGKAEHTEHASHSVVGITLQYFDLFAAAQIDRYRDPVFSAKLGVRF